MTQFYLLLLLSLLLRYYYYTELVFHTVGYCHLNGKQ